MRTLEITSNPFVESTVPQVLLNYLHELLEQKADVQKIVLTSRKLGDHAIQEICLETASGTVTRRVFGFIPVEAHLKVCVYENSIELAIAA